MHGGISGAVHGGISGAEHSGVSGAENGGISGAKCHGRFVLNVRVEIGGAIANVREDVVNHTLIKRPKLGH